MFNIKPIDRMDSATPWTVLSTDTVNLAASSVKVTGKYSLEFDKADGDANGKTAGAYRTVDLDLEGEGIQLHDKIQWAIYLSALTDVASCHVKLGTDASNNLQWTVSDTSLRTGWTLCTGVIGEPSAVNGTGWDPTNITYMSVGVTFDAQDDTLADIKIDSVNLVPSRYVEDNTIISMDGVSIEANLDALETLVAASNVLLGTIDADTGAIKTATELLDNAVGTQDSAAPTGVLNVGGEYESSLSEMDDGDIAALAIDAFRRIISSNHDSATGTGLVTDLTAVSGVPFRPSAQTALTAPGDGVPVDVEGYNQHTVAVKVVLGGCSSVVVRIDGSLDGTNYGICTLDSTATANSAYSNNLVTIDADVTVPLKLSGHYKKLKPVFVSEAGDTDSTVTFQVRAGN